MDEAMIEPTTLFKALADETRLRCLILLIHEQELCVCELCHALDITQPKISRHLATLRNNGVVQDRRSGQWIYYSLHPELATWATQIMQNAAQGARSLEPFTRDQQRLTSMPDRPTRCCS
ncbi:MAG: metalloregulator ArsR/SmtB family transcription factor [Magnetococcales bacterium]|nr:metalloregulator ArsR/SmtB family transcription factor [Magnetococcales bacterium]